MSFPEARQNTDPAQRTAEITPHDSTELDPIPKAIWVGTAGDLVYRGRYDSADRTAKVPQGVFPVLCKLIKATGTTASDLIALYD